MNRIAGACCALLVAAFAAGCGHTEVHDVILRPPQPASPSPPEIYFGTRPPPRPFYEVGLIQVIGYGSDANLEDLTHALSARAQRVGCDAVLRIHVDQGYSKAHMIGVCVRYLAAAPPAEAPPTAAPPVAPEKPPTDDKSY